MEIVGIITFVIIAIVVFGLLGLLLKVGGFVFDLLLDGCSEFIGCLAWIIAIIILFAVLL